MPRFLPWLILLFPALELWVLIQVGKEIGALSTVALVFFSVMVGLFLLRLRGLSVAKTMQADLAAGRLPANPLVDAFCLMIAGWLFIFPGFVSDAIALLLIIPGVRHLLLAFFASRMKQKGFAAQTVHFNSSTGAGGDSGATWTCTTYASSGSTNHAASGPSSPMSGDPYAKRGNALVIDCEPEQPDTGDTTVIDVDSTTPKQ